MMEQGHPGSMWCTLCYPLQSVEPSQFLRGGTCEGVEGIHVYMVVWRHL